MTPSIFKKSPLIVILLFSTLALAEEEIPFPKDFWFGTSLAAHQAEGDNHNNWTRWEETTGHIKFDKKSGRAVDHWDAYEKDFDNLKILNANAHRMSIEWSRLEPNPGEWNQGAVDHYRAMISSLKDKREIKPIICLFHFTLPLWVEDAGGFENPEMVKAFINFAIKVQQTFGDLVTDWVTVNEPMVYVVKGYQLGVFPPGVKDLNRAMIVASQLIKAHAEIYHAFKKHDANSQITFAQHLRVFSPFSRINPLDWMGARIVSQFFNWSWYDAIQTGKIKFSVPFMASFEEDCDQCKGALDYIGINYYGRDFVKVNPLISEKIKMVSNPKGNHSELGWEIYPEGLHTLLGELKERGLGGYPILITENGVAQIEQKDFLRIQFIHDHLKVFLESCREFGLQPKGYLHWTLMDNFEWTDGYTAHFGLYSVNLSTMERIPRESANYFRDLGLERRLLPVKY